MAKSNSISPIISHRYDGLFVVEGTYINPNGDPDADGAPRTDPTTGHGLISHASVHRRIRDRAAERYGQAIHIVRGRSIEDGMAEAAVAAGLEFETDADTDDETDEPKGKGKKSKGKSKAKMDTRAVTAAVTAKYFDVRMFGGVLGVGKIRGESVSGTISMATGKSVYPVDVQAHSGTRVCETNNEQDKNQDMLRRFYVGHAVYVVTFTVNPYHAKANGATMEDLAIFLDCLLHAYEDRRSGMSGQVNLRDLVLFRHDSPLGNAPSWKLLESYHVTCDNPMSARSWGDYKVSLDAAPKGIHVYRFEDLFGGKDAILKRLGA